MAVAAIAAYRSWNTFAVWLSKLRQILLTKASYRGMKWNYSRVYCRCRHQSAVGWTPNENRIHFIHNWQFFHSIFLFYWNKVTNDTFWAELNDYVVVVAVAAAAAVVVVVHVTGHTSSKYIFFNTMKGFLELKWTMTIIDTTKNIWLCHIHINRCFLSACCLFSCLCIKIETRIILCRLTPKRNADLTQRSKMLSVYRELLHTAIYDCDSVFVQKIGILQLA